MKSISADRNIFSYNIINIIQKCLKKEVKNTIQKLELKNVIIYFPRYIYIYIYIIMYILSKIFLLKYINIYFYIFC